MNPCPCGWHGDSQKPGTRAGVGDAVRYLFSDDKRQRILAARQRWPHLPGKAIAVIAGASPSYVSEVLNEMEPEGLST